MKCHIVDFKQIRGCFSCSGTAGLDPSERNWQKQNFLLVALKAVFSTMTPQTC